MDDRPIIMSLVDVIKLYKDAYGLDSVEAIKRVQKDLNLLAMPVSKLKM